MNLYYTFPCNECVLDYKISAFSIPTRNKKDRKIHYKICPQLLLQKWKVRTPDRYGIWSSPCAPAISLRDKRTQQWLSEWTHQYRQKNYTRWMSRIFFYQRADGYILIIDKGPLFWIRMWSFKESLLYYCKQ